jgi:hypothetical protein
VKHIQCKIETATNEKLCQEFTDEEISYTLFQISRWSPLDQEDTLLNLSKETGLNLLLIDTTIFLFLVSYREGEQYSR